MPLEIKNKKRRSFGAGGGYVFMEFIGAKGEVFTCGIERSGRVYLNGYRVALDANTLLNKYLKGYLGPHLNWHGKYQGPKIQRDSDDDDGYVVVYSPGIKKMIKEGKLADLVGKVDPLAAEWYNQIVVLGIEVKTKRVVSVRFLMNSDDRRRGGMNEAAYQKYLQALNAYLKISGIKNQHELKADVVHRFLDFTR